ncbi:hypothetical protein D3C86_1875510 [compost metagenome]
MTYALAIVEASSGEGAWTLMASVLLLRVGAVIVVIFWSLAVSSLRCFQPLIFCSRSVRMMTRLAMLRLLKISTRSADLLPPKPPSILAIGPSWAAIPAVRAALESPPLVGRRVASAE